MSTEQANPTNGRPAGEVRRALLQAAVALNMGDKAPTLRELARAACVGQTAARVAVSNMRRAGSLVIVRERRVAYRARPVAEYAPAAMACTASHSFQALASAWAPSTI
jgi:DNA-binding transcriptional regulator YhcF (GntR family)